MHGKPRIFVSFHHKSDQFYFEKFEKAFGDDYDVIMDNSRERALQTDKAEYLMHIIRQDYVAGSACTVVLCGPHTPFRKYVDWEIDATLWEEHPLIGIKLPDLLVINDRCAKPDRLQDNVDSGYVVWTWWEVLMNKPTLLPALIAEAHTKPKSLIRNKRPRRLVNG
jgi:hypothetical protein